MEGRSDNGKRGAMREIVMLHGTEMHLLYVVGIE